MDINEIMLAGVPWGYTMCLLVAFGMPDAELQSAGSVRLLPSHGTEGRTSHPSESTAVCQLEIHCTRI